MAPISVGQSPSTRGSKKSLHKSSRTSLDKISNSRHSLNNLHYDKQCDKKNNHKQGQHTQSSSQNLNRQHNPHDTGLVSMEDFTKQAERLHESNDPGLIMDELDDFSVSTGSPTKRVPSDRHEKNPFLKLADEDIDEKTHNSHRVGVNGMTSTESNASPFLMMVDEKYQNFQNQDSHEKEPVKVSEILEITPQASNRESIKTDMKPPPPHLVMDDNDPAFAPILHKSEVSKSRHKSETLVHIQKSTQSVSRSTC